MPESPEQSLSARDREILRGIIGVYLLSGEPVSSRRMAKDEQVGLSAASLRNIMADLEELGYLLQPHTSAGRVPTARGYHLFIDSLMTTEGPGPEEREVIDQRLSETDDPESLASATSGLLSELSQQVGIVVTTDFARVVLKSVEFVPLSGQKILCVAVAAGGFVDHKVVETEHVLTREELIRVSNYLTEHFGGLSLQEMRDRLVVMLHDARSEVNELLSQAADLAQKGLNSFGGNGLVIEGTESLLSHPELADLDRVRTLFDTFADKARVVEILSQCVRGDGVRVYIGQESDLTSPLDFSLITRTYGAEGQAAGSIGVFGPSRMPYSRLVPLVEYLGDRLSTALSSTLST
ncbi:MAG: heat-inducible transcriptional repressor HrcA [Acidobacteriota bacterium]